LRQVSVVQRIIIVRYEHYLERLSVFMYNMSERQNHGPDTEKMYSHIDRQRRDNSDTLFLLDLQLTSLPYNEFYGFKSIYLTDINGIKDFDDSEIKDATLINLKTCESLETINITKSCYKSITIYSCHRVTKLKCYARNSLYLDDLNKLKTFEIAYPPECPDGIENLTIINAQELENITFETVDGKRTYITRRITITAAPKLKKNLVLHKYGVQPTYIGDYFTNETRVVERPPSELLHSEEDYGPDTEKMYEEINLQRQARNESLYLVKLKLTSLPYKEFYGFKNLLISHIEGLKEFDDSEIKDITTFIFRTCEQLETINITKSCYETIDITSCNKVTKMKCYAKNDIVLEHLHNLKNLEIVYSPECPDGLERLKIIKAYELENIDFETVDGKRTYVTEKITIRNSPKLKKDIVFFKEGGQQPTLEGNYFTTNSQTINQDYGLDTEEMFEQIKGQEGRSDIFLSNLNLTSLPYKEFEKFETINIFKIGGLKEINDNELSNENPIELIIDECPDLEKVIFRKHCFGYLGIYNCDNIEKIEVSHSQNFLVLVNLEKLKTITIHYIECDGTSNIEQLEVYVAPELENIEFETVGGKRTYITNNISIDDAPKLKKDIVFYLEGQQQPKLSGNYFTDQPRVVERPPPELLHSEEDYGPDTEKLLKTIKDQSGNNQIFLSGLNLTSLPYKQLEKFESLTLTRVKGLKEINDNDITDEKFIELTIDACPDLEKVILKKHCLGHFEIRNCDNVEIVEVSNASYNLDVSNLSKLKTLIIHYVPDCGVSLISDAEIDKLSVTDVPVLENIEFEKVNDKRTVIVSEVLIHDAPKLKKDIVFFKEGEEPPVLIGDYFTDQPRVVERELPAFDNNRRRDSFSESEDGLDTYSDLEEEIPKSAYERDYPDVDIPEVKVKFENQKIIDFIELTEIPLLNFLCRPDQIIFKAKDSYFPVPRKTLQEDTRSGLAIRYKCKKETLGAPLLSQVELDQPYVYISGNGNFLVKYDHFVSAVGQYKILELVETGQRVNLVSSEQNIQTDYRGLNIHGNRVNITSGNHCQAGTGEMLSDIRGVILEVEETAGRKTRRQIRKPSYKTRKVQKKSK
jgi:hypothetical protein